LDAEDKNIKIDPILSIIGAYIHKPLLIILKMVSASSVEKLVKYEDKFPKTVILQVKDSLRSFPVRQLFAFSQMRKFIMQHIEVTPNGEEDHEIKFQTDSSGVQQDTLNIEHMDVDLADLEILIKLLEENE
jgi:hydroxymethylpyrimidine pyrophosphatase-like HAD family hydrolase